MPIRLPFLKRNDQHGEVANAPAAQESQAGDAGTEQNGRLAAKPAPVNIQKSRRDEEANTYKLQVVSGGIYLPPSPPPERQKFWRRTASSHSVPKEPPSEEPFVISRESFDSYRRSFDISARSPITDISNQRRSLDVRQRPSMYTPPRTARASESSERAEFEDVDLNDENENPKRRGLLSKVLGHNDTAQNKDATGRHLVPLPSFHKKQHNTIHESELERIDKQKKTDAEAKEATAISAAH